MRSCRMALPHPLSSYEEGLPLGASAIIKWKSLRHPEKHINIHWGPAQATPVIWLIPSKYPEFIRLCDYKKHLSWAILYAKKLFLLDCSFGDWKSKLQEAVFCKVTDCFNTSSVCMCVCLYDCVCMHTMCMCTSICCVFLYSTRTQSMGLMA